jgi:hypothetical protein
MLMYVEFVDDLRDGGLNFWKIELTGFCVVHGLKDRGLKELADFCKTFLLCMLRKITNRVSKEC